MQIEFDNGEMLTFQKEIGKFAFSIDTWKYTDGLNGITRTISSQISGRLGDSEKEQIKLLIMELEFQLKKK